MRSVMISIKPYWVFLIIAKTMGWAIDKQKTVEVRKTRPQDDEWKKVGKIYNQTEAWYKDIYILNKGKYAKAPVVNVDGEKAVKMYGNVYVTKYDETRKAWLVNTKYGLYRF